LLAVTIGHKEDGCGPLDWLAYVIQYQFLAVCYRKTLISVHQSSTVGHLYMYCFFEIIKVVLFFAVSNTLCWQV